MSGTSDQSARKPANHTAFPLTEEAMKIVETLRTGQYGPYLFTSYQGKPMSRYGDVDLHEARGPKPSTSRVPCNVSHFGLRSRTDTPYAVKESSLAHQVGNDVVRAYQRSDLLERRRVLLSEWSQYLVK